MITLKQLCEETGVSRRAVQGYEKEKLLSPAEKDKMGHLLYEETAIEKVWKIRLFQYAGMTLKEIKMMESLDKAEQRKLLKGRLLEMEEENESLQKHMAELKRYIECI